MFVPTSRNIFASISSALLFVTAQPPSVLQHRAVARRVLLAARHIDMRRSHHLARELAEHEGVFIRQRRRRRRAANVPP